MPTDSGALRQRIDRVVDEDPIKLRDALYAVLRRLDAECDGAARQMAAGDYCLCPPDMLRVYCHDAIREVIGA